MTEPSLPKGACLALLRPIDGRWFLLTVSRPDSALRCMPGGKREPHEDGPENAVRETQEETGLAIPRSALRPVYEGPCPSQEAARYRVNVYGARWEPGFGEPRACEPTVVPAWTPWDDYLGQAAFPDFDARALACLQSVWAADPLAPPI